MNPNVDRHPTDEELNVALAQQKAKQPDPSPWPENATRQVRRQIERRAAKVSRYEQSLQKRLYATEEVPS